MSSTAFERLTPSQVEAMAETLWDFAWNPDPNDPVNTPYSDAAESAKLNYREWSRAIFLASEREAPQHTWDRDFPHER